MSRIAIGIETDVAGNYQQRLNNREKKVVESVINNENIDDDFPQALVVSNFDNVDGTIYTGAAAEVLSFHSGRAAYEVYQAAVATPAVIAPFQNSTGLVLQPVAAADAFELTNGTTALAKSAYVVGSFLRGKKIYFEATIKIADISDVTEAFFGWRKAEAYQVDPDSYAAVAAFHIGATDDGRISITTSVSSTETVVDTTLADWADGETHTLRIEVTDEGLCKFLYDAAAPTVDVPGFSFTAAEVIVPFFHVNTETGDPVVSISSWEVGYM